MPDDAVDPIPDFYDRHPYPPPIDRLDSDRADWRDPMRRRADFHLLWPANAFREDEEILVAGCGTSQAARYAVRHPDAHVTGIDVSAASLDHTRKLAGTYRLTNLELHELPVEAVAKLGRSFDRIVCTGVLHHLRDPDAGLRALRDVLKLDGAIHLMVYAPYGRVGITMVQDYCRRLGVGTSAGELRDLAAVLEMLPRDHPLAYLLHTSPDFRRPDALADALLNPRERAYSVPQLFAFLERAGLSFGRWYRQAPYLAQCGDVARTPHAARLGELPAPESYAAVELLRGTMLRHSVIAYRNDSPCNHFRDDDIRWPETVPIRLPHTRCVEKRTRTGVITALLNQSHPFPDLVLPIRAGEKRLFDAIDGSRTIAEIADRASLSLASEKHRAPVRTFFDRLWWYDQVVFDASGNP